MGMHFYLSRKLLLAWQARGRQIDWVEIGLWHKFQFSWRFFWQNCVRNDIFLKKMWCKIVQEILGTLPSGVDDCVTGQGKQRIEVFRPLQRVAMKSYMCHPSLHPPNFCLGHELKVDPACHICQRCEVRSGLWEEILVLASHQMKAFCNGTKVVM